MRPGDLADWPLALLFLPFSAGIVWIIAAIRWPKHRKPRDRKLR